MKKKYLLIIIAALILIIILQRSCKKPDCPPCDDCPELIDTDTVIIYDTIHKNKYITKIKYQNVYIEIPIQPIDTSEILKAYYTVRFSPYVFEDKNVKITINDSISRNFIKNRNLDYKVFVQTKVITNNFVDTIFQPKRRQLYAGFELGTNTKLNKLNVGPELIYKDKQDNMYGYRYGIFDQTHNLKMHWKISWAKN